jgi:hypothetical protein
MANSIRKFKPTIYRNTKSLKHKHPRNRISKCRRQYVCGVRRGEKHVLDTFTNTGITEHNANKIQRTGKQDKKPTKSNGSVWKACISKTVNT